MKVISWLKYFVFLLLIVLVLWVQGKAQNAFETQFTTTYKINHVMYLAAMLLPILVGLIIGLESFINESRKEGRWKLNLPKLIIFIIPSLFATSLYFILLSQNEKAYNFFIKPFFNFFNGSGFITMLEILLGYSIITLMYKAKVNQVAMEEGINEYHAEADPIVDHNEFIEGSNEVIIGSDDSVVDNEDNKEVVNEESGYNDSVITDQIDKVESEDKSNQ